MRWARSTGLDAAPGTHSIRGDSLRRVRRQLGGVVHGLFGANDGGDAGVGDGAHGDLVAESSPGGEGTGGVGDGGGSARDRGCAAGRARSPGDVAHGAFDSARSSQGSAPGQGGGGMSGTRAEPPEPLPAYVLAELTIVIAGANPLSPAVLTAEYLKEVGVVPGDFTVVPDHSFVGPGAAQVFFEEQVVIAATTEQVSIQQGGEGEIFVPQIAQRFSSGFPGPYSAIGINPKVFRPMSHTSPVQINEILVERGRWLRFGDHDPQNTQIQVQYVHEHRNLSLNVTSVRARSVSDENTSLYGLLFEGNIHRGLPDTTYADRSARIAEVLDGWESDISDFVEATSLFTNIWDD